MADDREKLLIRLKTHCCAIHLRARVLSVRGVACKGVWCLEEVFFEVQLLGGGVFEVRFLW